MSLLSDGADCECECAVGVGDAVLRQRNRAPAVLARETLLHFVIIDLYGPLREVAGRGPYILVEVSHLRRVGIGDAIGIHHAVYAEVAVACVQRVEVSAVSVYLHAILACCANGLVNEVPDESTCAARAASSEA